MEFIVFFNYEDGTREFEFYDDEEETESRYRETVAQAKKYGSRVEIGIAQITDTTKTYVSDLK
ncbi:hypothetical protein [Paenibacillus chitinolyticus]|uniref:hypothetical protein n=1 Tax=Paenibacillus chitinolyticus TaxID=79263 RepID=UPI001C43891C|nr:hypothetical protein [Paenibacillus chitinolyticus]MBV6717264.1 hypothetical protein [Paenibacillus chitinolyticus]